VCDPLLTKTEGYLLFAGNLDSGYLWMGAQKWRSSILFSIMVVLDYSILCLLNVLIIPAKLLSNTQSRGSDRSTLPSLPAYRSIPQVQARLPSHSRPQPTDQRHLPSSSRSHLQLLRHLRTQRRTLMRSAATGSIAILVPIACIEKPPRTIEKTAWPTLAECLTRYVGGR
jgi:hypothetical protein